MAEVQTIRQLPPEFIEAAGKTYLSDLQKAVGDFKTTRSWWYYGSTVCCWAWCINNTSRRVSYWTWWFSTFLNSKHNN